MSAAGAIDVLVVGLGPAGSRAAAEAARAGCAVMAVDRRRRAGFPVQCAEFVPAPLGQEIAGLAPATRQAIRAMQTFVEDRAPDIKENFPGHIIDRAAFDAALVRAAQAQGADCRFATVVAGFDGDGTARLSDGTALRPRLVIGADGPRSAVGRAIGRVNRALVETRQITAPLHIAHAATDIFLAADIPGGYGWLFPKGDVANIGVGVVPAAKNRLKALLERLHQALIAEGRVGSEILARTGGAIPVGGMLDPVGATGAIDGRGGIPVLLAGDAAGLSNPVTGAGIASAAISGALAGAAAAECLAGDADALAEYAAELRALFGRALDRALRRRVEILRHYEDRDPGLDPESRAGPSPAALRRGWIAYDEYWAEEYWAA